ncbi:hypothetical protein PZA11_003204 [Diplocarpon coronariae]
MTIIIDDSSTLQEKPEGEPSSGKGVAVNVDEELGQELLARSRFILVGDKLAQEVAIG